MRLCLYSFLVCCTSSLIGLSQTPLLIAPPAGSRYCAIDPSGETVLPNGRLIAPMGNTVRIAPHPFGLALSNDGSMAVTANSGIRPFSITLIDQLAQPQPRVRQIPEGPLGDPNVLADVFMGLAITPDNRGVWVAGGQSNKVYFFDLAKGEKTDSIAIEGEGYLGEMALSNDGHTLYVCDQANFQLLVLDTRSRRLLHRVPTGRYPFGVALSPDGKTAYVANVGVFAYSPLTKPTDQPVFAYHTRRMRRGSKNAPGLGSPNAPEAFSVWAIDVQGTQPRVLHRIKTGFLVGEPIEGIPAVTGAGPDALVATDQYVFVSNGNNDCISVIEAKTGHVLRHLHFRPLPALSRMRGAIPFGLALSPDRRRLYVAVAGLNAVAIIDVPTLTILGYLPVGWFPAKVAVMPDGKRLVVANAKGYGSGPNGGRGFQEGPEGSYVGHLMRGSVTVLDIPPDADLPRYTERVLSLNFRQIPLSDSLRKARLGHPVPLPDAQKKGPIKYWVFIAKENRTYDEVFGQLANGRGDATLARYGAARTFQNRAKTQTVTNVSIMPNHLALAQRFALSDNFYVDADVSADGHRWLVNTYPNQWVETNVAALYGGRRNVRSGSRMPGRWAWTGSAGAIFPEDYNEAGSLWDHLARHRVPFYNWGFGTEMPHNLTDSTMKYYGQRVTVNYPVPAPLYKRTSWRYPTYNMAIPDQFRADLFLEEFKTRWGTGGKALPQVLTILLPNDHGGGERPAAGYPYRESYMADNDLALGRIVAFLSRTAYWKEMAIVITEDDAQDGRDHVDAHRSLLMVCSPYAKRGYIGHTHYSFGSIFKTFWQGLGLPYLNQYDASAADLADLFTTVPDFTPYTWLPPDPRVLDPQKLLTPFDKNFDWKALLESPELDDPEDFIRAKKEGN